MPKATIPLHDRYLKILKNTTPYLLTYPGNLKYYNLKPFGIRIPPENVLDCTSHKNSVFYDLLQRLDQLSFGPVGMPMDKWVFYDCGEMPGGIFGFALKADAITPEGRDAFLLNSTFAGYQGLVPISMYITIPFPKKGLWFGHNLSSAGKQLGAQELPGLGIFSKSMAIDVFRVNEMIGATQWDSPSLNIHLQLSDMEILSAYTPAHTFPKTMTYRSRYTKKTQTRALSGVPREAASYDFLLVEDDEEKMKEIQREIEDAGGHFIIHGRPIRQGEKSAIPISRIKTKR